MVTELNDEKLEKVAGGVSESDFSIQPGQYFCTADLANVTDPSPCYRAKYFVYENNTIYLKADYFYLNPSRGKYYYYGGFYELFTADQKLVPAILSGEHPF